MHTVKSFMTYASVKNNVLLVLSALLLNTSLLHAAEPTKNKEQSFFENAATAKPEGRQFAQKPEEPVVVQAAEDNVAYHVRCWQNGLLILDEPNWRSPQIQTRFAAMKQVGGSVAGLYLIELGTAFCQLKKQ